MKYRSLKFVLSSLLVVQNVAAAVHDDSLQTSFKGLQKFAREAEASIVNEAALSREQMRPLDEEKIDPKITDDFQHYLAELTKTRIIGTPLFSHPDYDVPVLRELTAGVRGELKAIIMSLLTDVEAKSIYISLKKSPFPYIEVVANQDQQLIFTISLGSLALTRNRDELGALIAQAIARRFPKIFSVADDPRILRRLNDQMNFDALSPLARSFIRADISALERLRACSLRPWGLTDYELRVFTFFRETYARSRLFAGNRRLYSYYEGSSFFADPTVEARLLAQKVIASYMQERENLRELIETKHPFGPELQAAHERCAHWVDPHFKRFGYTRKAVARASLPILYLGELTGKLAPTLEYLGDKANWIAGLAHISESPPYLHVQHQLVELGTQVETSVAPFFAMNRHALYMASMASIDGVFVGYHYTLGFLFHYIGQFFAWFGPAIVAVFNFIVEDVFLPFFHLVADFASWKILASVVTLVLGYLLIRHPPGPLKMIGELALTTGKMFVLTARDEVAYYWNLKGSNRRLRAYTQVGDQVDVKFLKTIAAELDWLYYYNFRAPIDQRWQSKTANVQFLWSLLGQQKPWLKFTARFLLLLAEHVRRGHLTIGEVEEILMSLHVDDGHITDRFDYKLDRFENGPHFEMNIGDQMFREVRLENGLRELYRALREHFPRQNSAAKSFAVMRLSDLNETGVHFDRFLGLARLLDESEKLKTEFDLAKLIDLNSLLQSLRAGALIGRINKTHFLAASEAIFSKGVDLYLAEVYRDSLESYLPLRMDRPKAHQRSTFPLYGAELAARQMQAAGAGNLGAFVAIDGWHTLNKTPVFGFTFKEIIALPPNLLQLTMELHHAADWALERKLRHFSRLTEMSAWVEEELVQRAMPPDLLVARMYKEIMARPTLITNREDFDDLIAHEFYWPEVRAPNENIAHKFWDAFNRVVRDFEPIEQPLTTQLAEYKNKYPRAWRYDSVSVSQLHEMLIHRLGQLGLMPKDYAPLKAIWRQLTNRGVTPVTDRILHQLIQLAPSDEFDDLMESIVKEGRVWETDLHSRLSLAKLTSSGAYKKLLAADPHDPSRHDLLELLIEELQTTMPERGLTYVNFLEELSRKMLSTYTEAKTIAGAKANVSNNINSDKADRNLAALSAVFKSIRSWPRYEQFNLLLVLRGEAKPSARVLAAFPEVGLERVRRMYEILPVPARVGALDTFFTLSLIRDGVTARVWTRRLVKHIVGGQESESQRISLQILTAFLSAVNEVGNGNLTTTILSYLYALPSTATASPGETLKRVLEVFGATGIKLGQFLLASQILPESEARHLRSLTDQARVPTRIEMYEDLYEILGLPPGTPLPFYVLDLLGAASMKYAFLGQDRENLQAIVLKIFRLDAKNNVDLQFEILDRMSRYLVKRFGDQYGALDVIIESARQAVRREGSMPNEIRRSEIARKFLYHGKTVVGVDFEVPREVLITPRLISAEYAEGVSFNELDPAIKPLIAQALLEMEIQHYFGENRVIRFEPDRHAGNYRIFIRALSDHQLEVQLEPFNPSARVIDFGQLSRMSRTQRDLIIRLFAIAQIANRAGVNEWVLNRLTNLLGLDEVQRFKLSGYLRRYLKKTQKKPIPIYTAMLAALKRSGYPLPNTSYIDFIRGIIQLTQYEEFAPGANSPRKMFEQRVFAAVAEEWKTFEFDPAQKFYVDSFNKMQSWRASLTGSTVNLLPTKDDEINLGSLNQDSCGENLRAE